MNLDAPDAALAAALTQTDDASGTWTIAALAEAIGTTPTVVEAIVREGLLTPVSTNPMLFGAGAADTLRSGMALLEAGLPLGELLDLAGRANTALRDLADHAVDVFLAFVRDPARAGDDDDEVAAQLLAAFDTMLPAAARLVGDHFRDLVLEVARDRVSGES